MEIKLDVMSEENDFKINMAELESLNEKENTGYFGAWIHNIQQLKEEFKNADPFSYVKIDNFLDGDYAEILFEKFPRNYENWHKYTNPIEVKYAYDNLKDMAPEMRKLFYVLSTNEITGIFSEIASIPDLEYDPYLHGAGLHAHSRYGRLNMHLDYEKHPKLESKQRRLNVILFLTKDWREEWNGDNQLWDKDMEECKVKTYPKFNSAIIFQTNEISWHGLPDKIMCPTGVYRKSFAYYYLSPLITQADKNKFGANEAGYRTKATFIKRPTDIDLPQMKKLYKIRPNRRIEEKDMKEIWPEWSPDIF